MVGEASGYALPALETHDALHYADGHLGLREYRPLFDVQLEIAGQTAARDTGVGKMRRVLAVATQPIGEGEALLVLAFENLRPQQPGGNTRAQGAQPEVMTFFIAPDDDLEGVARLDGALVERADYFDGAHAPDVAIEVSPVGHRVDMGAEQQGRQIQGALPPTEEVSGRVDAHLETRLLHQAGDIVSSGQVGFRETDAGDTALGFAAELAQFLEGALQTLRVDMRTWGAGRLGLRRR